MGIELPTACRLWDSWEVVGFSKSGLSYPHLPDARFLNGGVFK